VSLKHTILEHVGAVML